MTPKIVTRLANIAAKLAGSDKYDPTIEPATAFEYYLDKGVDKILAIKGVPAAEAGDAGKVLTVSDMGTPVWQGLLSATATPTSETAGTWTGATWDAIKNDIQHGKVILVTIPTGAIYVLFNGIARNSNSVELATSYPMPMFNQYRTITILSNGEYTIDAH